MDARSKVMKLLEFKSMIPTDSSSMADGARQFTITAIKPITSCLQNYWNGDIDSFVQHWKSISTSSFAKDKCSGVGVTCNSRI
jgi:hypothetical protein